MAGFDSLSQESRVRRYLFNKNWISESELGKLTSPDGVNHIAFGLAVNMDDAAEQPIAVARCFRDQQEQDATGGSCTGGTRPLCFAHE